MRVSDSEPLLEFSRLGQSEGNELCGRGSFYFSTPREGKGTLFIHTGGQSGVSICRATPHATPIRTLKGAPYL